MVKNMDTKVIIIRGKAVNYGMDAINEVYGLRNHDIEPFTTKDCALGSSLESNSWLGKNVPWVILKVSITPNELTVEARN